MRVRTPRPDGGCHQCWTSPFSKLAAGGQEQVRSGEPRTLVEEREGVLQLVAEAVRAARLVEPGATPEATGQGLVQQPVIHQQIDGCIGRLDVDSAQIALPGFPDLFQHAPGSVNAAMLYQQGSRIVFAVGRAEHEDDLRLFAGRNLNRRLDRRAGVDAAADPVGELSAGPWRRGQRANRCAPGTRSGGS